MDALMGNQLCNVTFAPSVITLPASLGLLLLAPVRIFQLRNETVKVSFGKLAYAKLVFSSLLLLLKLAQLVVAVWSGFHSQVELLGLCGSLIAIFMLIWLSIAEHKRSIRPSTLTAVYLLIVLCGSIVAGSPELVSSQRFKIRVLSTALWCAEVLTQLVLLVLEYQNKVEAALSPYKSIPPEDAAGILSRTFWWWLMDLLAAGKRRNLRISDTPRLSESLQPRLARKGILQAWNKRAKSEDGYVLLKVVAGSLTKPLLSPIIPRVFVTIFRCSQPVIIARAITFVTNNPDGDIDSCEAYKIFFAALTVYFGLAISNSMYIHRLNRLEVLIRTSLVNMVYEKSLNLSHDGTDAGRVVTIMSTDIDSVTDMGRLLHASWGQLFELVGGLVLLAREVGWLFPVPVVTIFIASRMSRFVAQNVRSRTKTWNDATQARISTLSSILGSMRGVKAMGLSDPIKKHVESLRGKEIDGSKHVRWMQVAYNASANANGIFTPVITVVLYAILAASRGVPLDTKTAFTTVAVLLLVTHPANMIMTIVPRVIGSLGNVDRIQSFLLESPRIDSRKVIHGDNYPAEREIETGIRLDDVTIRFSKNAAPTLSNIDLDLPKHSITICGGPTGCGKTTLARTILGEISPTHGVVTVSSSRIAYCDQRAWVPTGTIRQVICAFADVVDEKLYEDALNICCLGHDLQRLPDGDETVVGSRGVNLSGGQRQRLALARMVYSGASIAVLDDPFSALDGTTENKVAENLLGREGWFRKAKVTTFLITHAAQHFQYSDRVILLENSRVAMQGDWRTLKDHSSEMQKFSFHETDSPYAETKSMVVNGTSKQAEKDAERDLDRRVGNLSLYSYYIRSVGIWNFLLLAACTALYTLNIFTTYWFKLWTESDGKHTLYYISGYVLLTFIAWVATSANLWSTYILLAPRSGRLLHESLLQTTMAAPLQYFSSTDVGVILNRFSKDISLVDRQLPSALSALCAQIFKMLLQIILLAQVQRPLLAALPVCTLIVYLVQKVYLRTSRQLRVLELESHSSLNSWFLETMEGLLSIRAFNWIKPATDKNLENLETSIRPAYSLASLQCWLSLMLDLIVSCIAVGIIFIAAAWRSETSPGNIGVSLNLILIANTTLQRLVESFTQLEVSLGAIARLKEVEMTTPKEDKADEDQVPPTSWPAQGHLTLSKFTAGYGDGHMVLKDINLSVEEGRKLVICGRTGSGKSTIVLGLLRLIESCGSVEIDQHILSRIPRNLVRSRAFITVTQEPFFLPDASLRFNLDPDAVASDEMLRGALQIVGIWDAVCGMSHHIEMDPLSQPVSNLQALSVGQLQLISMARAVLKKNILSQGWKYSDSGNDTLPKPILLLDEATSSLDTTTEEVIYNIIENEFIACGYTVVIVAHRISVLAKTMRPGKDKVAWLQDGQVVKVGDYDEIAQFASSAVRED